MKLFEKIQNACKTLVTENAFFHGFRHHGKRCYIQKAFVKRKLSHAIIGDHVKILKGWRIECFEHYGDRSYSPKLIIGNYVNIMHNFTCLVADQCIIGDNAAIASDVFISTENHGITPDGTPYIGQPLTTAPVTIGKHVWIGEKACILPGVELGDFCIVGAHSVVTKSFPAYSMIAGVPARIIKKYNPETREWERV